LIARLRADMESGVTTSKEITEAYLDRIEFYDTRQFGFNAYGIVASDAIEQAKAADHARKQVATRVGVDEGRSHARLRA